MNLCDCLAPLNCYVCLSAVNNMSVLIHDQLLWQSWQVMNAHACRVTGGELVGGGLSTSWLGNFVHMHASCQQDTLLFVRW